MLKKAARIRRSRRRKKERKKKRKKAFCEKKKKKKKKKKGRQEEEQKQKQKQKGRQEQEAAAEAEAEADFVGVCVYITGQRSGRSRRAEEEEEEEQKQKQKQKGREEEEGERDFGLAFAQRRMMRGAAAVCAQMELKMPYPCLLHQAAPRPRLTLNLHSSSFAMGFAADHGHRQDLHQHQSPSSPTRMSPAGLRLSPSPRPISANHPTTKMISSPPPRAISANPRLISPRAQLDDPRSTDLSSFNKQQKKRKPPSSSSPPPPLPPKHSLASPNHGLAADYEPESSPNRGLAADYEPESCPNRGLAADYEPESSSGRGFAADYEPESCSDRGLAAGYEPESWSNRGLVADYEPESSFDRGFVADYEPGSSPNQARDQGPTDRGDAGAYGSVDDASSNPSWTRGDRLAESLDYGFSAVDTSLAARQALERLLIDDGGTSAASDSNGVPSSPDRSDDRSLQDAMYDMVSSRLLLHAHRPQQKSRDRRSVVGRNEWLYDLLPADVRPSLDRHVAMVINGDENCVDPPFDPAESAQVRKLDLGRMSAASAMQGYFLERVHRRFQLDQRLGSTIGSIDSYVKEHRDALKPLRALQCSQTVDVIERYVETLFGKASAAVQTGASQSQNLTDDIVDIRLDNLESLILHALAFGALLWDAESRLILQGSFVPRHHPS